MDEPILHDPKVFEDERGYFHQVVLDTTMDLAQVNHSFSVKGVLRGMHFQPGQAKYVYCFIGEIYDVIVDVRKDSPTYMEWKGYTLSGKNRNKLYVPDGYAHGFFVVSETAHVMPFPENVRPPRKHCWQKLELAMAARALVKYDTNQTSLSTLNKERR